VAGVQEVCALAVMDSISSIANVYQTAERAAEKVVETASETMGSVKDQVSSARK